jgi:hypothetical protein
MNYTLSVQRNNKTFLRRKYRGIDLEITQGSLSYEAVEVIVLIANKQLEIKNASSKLTYMYNTQLEERQARGFKDYCYRPVKIPIFRTEQSYQYKQILYYFLTYPRSISSIFF